MKKRSYACILADPPWPMYGGGGRGAQEHYQLLDSVEDIHRAIVESGVWKVATNAHLWLWVTNNYLLWGLELMQRLEFRYVTNLCWGKCRRVSAAEILQGTGMGRVLSREAIGVMLATLRETARGLYRKQPAGVGHYLRGQHELCLFGVRGGFIGMKPQDSLLLAPRGRHSEKPGSAYEVIEAVSPGPRLELFARSRREGWDAWGNEV